MSTDVRIKEQLPELTRRIVDTYQDVPTIHYLGHCPLPNYEAIISACEDLKEILYPGYRRRENLHLGNVTYHVGDLVDGLHDKLTTQIGRALRHSLSAQRAATAQGVEAPAVPDTVSQCSEEGDFEALGQAKAVEFLERIPELRRVLATDVQAAYDGDPAVRTLDEVIFCYPGLEAVTIHRLAHLLHRLEVPLIPRMMAEWAHSRTGIDIHPGATIGDHFFIDHGTGVVIGETCEIGSHVKLYQGVTLGALSFQTDADGHLVRGTKRHPTIEDGVVIYANATVLGGTTRIGHHSVIGSNVWLTRSIDPHTTVVLERPKLRMRGEMPDPSNDYQI
ncbi:MAG: serine acetyltransferase [Planctomycetota bacterium]|jgi:serine O-acetyltransferase|nr:MAG: serine acetyltransferase [Planctomycetota bacterium]